MGLYVVPLLREAQFPLFLSCYLCTGAGATNAIAEGGSGQEPHEAGFAISQSLQGNAKAPAMPYKPPTS
jgi:hypothetical protein